MSIAVLATGGTIDKDYPRATMGYAFEIDEPAANRVLGDLPLSVNFTTTSVLKKDSQEMTDADRERLVEALRELRVEVLRGEVRGERRDERRGVLRHLHRCAATRGPVHLS